MLLSVWLFCHCIDVTVPGQFSVHGDSKVLGFEVSFEVCP